MHRRSPTPRHSNKLRQTLQSCRRAGFRWGARVICAIALATPEAQAQVDCTAPMKYGVYDTYSQLSTHQQAAHIKEYISNIHYDASQVGGSDGSRIGIMVPIEGVPFGLDFGSQSSRTDSKRKVDSLVSSSDNNSSSSGMDRSIIKAISGKITDLVAKCFDSQTTGLIGYVVPDLDRKGFTVRVRYKNGNGVSSTVIRTLDVLPHAVRDQCSQGYTFLQNRMRLDNAELAFSCRLPAGAGWPVSYEINTDDGTLGTSIDLTEPPAPPGPTEIRISTLDGRYTGYVGRNPAFGGLITKMDAGPNVAGFSFAALAGRYNVYASYASSTARPMDVYLDLPSSPDPSTHTCPPPVTLAQAVLTQVMRQTTLGEQATDVRSFAIGTIDLTAGEHRLQFLHCGGDMPHLSSILLAAPPTN